MTAPTSAPATHTLTAPGATLTYDVRPGTDAAAPVVVLIGSPMGAAGFGTLREVPARPR